ncbi:hypothetical protein [Nonomuraea sp. JJY05]|jgi:hypothetical protein|uniref:hypothetical protein n=1 Tax=Nonomuraea sp. JJY05 TaxID=3350255 RepID=UPI00373E6A73
MTLAATSAGFHVRGFPLGFSQGRVYGRGVWACELVQRIARQAGITPKVTPHQAALGSTPTHPTPFAAAHVGVDRGGARDPGGLGS